MKKLKPNEGFFCKELKPTKGRLTFMKRVLVSNNSEKAKGV